MSTNRFSKRGWGEELGRWFVEPLAPAEIPKDRYHAARLLSSLLLVALGVALISVLYSLLASDVSPILLIGCGALAVTYGLSRTKHYTLAAVLTLIILAIPALASVLGGADPHEKEVRSHLVWLILPPLLATLFFSMRGMIIVTVTTLAAVMVLPLLNPLLSFASIGETLGLIIATSGILMVYMYHRNEAEERRQEQLRSSEARYRSLFKDSPVSLWEEDFSEVKRYLDGLRWAGVSDLRAHFEEHPEDVHRCASLVKVVDVSQATLELVGAADVQEFAEGLGTIFGEHSYQVFREELLTLAEGKTWFESEVLHRTLQGDGLYVTLRLTLAPGHEETWSKVFVSLVDITERKQAEETLQRSEQRYRALFERTNDAVFILDLEGVILATNQQAAKLLGYRVAEMPGMSTLDIITPSERPDSRKKLEILLAGESLPVYERVFRHRDGTEIPTEINVALVHDASGKPLHIQNVVRDITERKRAQLEREDLLRDLVHRSNQLLAGAEVSKAASTILDPEELTRDVVDVIQSRFGFYYVGLFLVDPAGEYAVLQAGTGQAGRRMLQAGHKLTVGGESMIGQCVALGEARIALDVGEEAVRFENPHLPLTRSETALPLISRGQCIGALTVQSNKEAAFSPGDVATLQSMADQLAIAIANARFYDQVQRYATHLEDLVAERTAELAAVNRELEAFAYSVSHDLRAPLRSIDGFGQALLEDHADTLDAVAQDYLWRMRAASQRMGQIIDDLLRLSRLTRREMSCEMVDLSALAQAVAMELIQREPERDVELIIAQDISAEGDLHLLRVALENLLGNAWKFTSKHPRARIEFGVKRDEEETVYYVRDDGAGFEMAHVDKLFGAFQRLHGMADFEGAGIGLATVQRIIHRHGGQVWAEGEVEQGATFYFTLP